MCNFIVTFASVFFNGLIGSNFLDLSNQGQPLVNVLNNRVYGIYCNVITVHNENTHRLWGYGSVGQLLNVVLVTLRRAGY